MYQAVATKESRIAYRGDTVGEGDVSKASTVNECPMANGIYRRGNGYGIGAADISAQIVSCGIGIGITSIYKAVHRNGAPWSTRSGAIIHNMPYITESILAY